MSEPFDDWKEIAVSDINTALYWLEGVTDETSYGFDYTKICLAKAIEHLQMAYMRIMAYS